MTACRSAGLNEFTCSSIVGLAEGEDDASADGLAEAVGLPGGITAGGVCATALVARTKLIKDNDVN